MEEKQNGVPAEETRDLYERFCACSVKELEEKLHRTESREEKLFYRAVLNLKIQLDQEKVVGKNLL